jgi:hypothetical protein
VHAVVAENLVRRNRSNAAFLELTSGTLLDGAAFRRGVEKRDDGDSRLNGSRANVGSLQVDWIVVAEQPHNVTVTANAAIRVAMAHLTDVELRAAELHISGHVERCAPGRGRRVAAQKFNMDNQI